MESHRETSFYGDNGPPRTAANSHRETSFGETTMKKQEGKAVWVGEKAVLVKIDGDKGEVCNG